jgi:hypothetical protein
MILDASLVAPERVRVLPHGGPKELLYHDGERRGRFLRLPRRTCCDMTYSSNASSNGLRKRCPRGLRW